MVEIITVHVHMLTTDTQLMATDWAAYCNRLANIGADGLTAEIVGPHQELPK